MSTTNTSTARKGMVWLLLAIIVVIAGAVWFWQSSKSTSAPNPRGPMGRGFMGEAVPVSVMDVERGVFTEQIRALGTVSAWHTAEVTSQVSGILEKIYFSEGQWVEQGDVLAELDARVYQAALLQAEGALQETKAQLASAELDLKRYRELRQADSIAQQTLEHQQATVNQLKGTLKVREAQRDAAKLNVEYSRIVAPISGRLGLRQLDVGNHVSAGSTVLVSITQQNPIAVQFTVPEQAIYPLMEAVSEGVELAVQAWSRDESILLAEGVLDSIDNRVDVATGTLRLKAKFDNANMRLFPQQFVNVVLKIRDYEDVLIVPSDTLQFSSKGSYVWRVLDEGRVEMVPVTIERADARRTVISAGLEAGETIVFEGVDRLREGGRVEVISTAFQPAQE